MQLIANFVVNPNPVSGL